MWNHGSTSLLGSRRKVAATMIKYHITALPMTIYFNRDGDHDHN
jgi:hypothetical protein